MMITSDTHDSTTLSLLDDDTPPRGPFNDVTTGAAYDDDFSPIVSIRDPNRSRAVRRDEPRDGRIADVTWLKAYGLRPSAA